MYKSSLKTSPIDISKQAQIVFLSELHQIELKGKWEWRMIDEHLFNIQLKNIPLNSQININAKNIEIIDTHGVYFIIRIIDFLHHQHIKISAVEFNPATQKLYKQIMEIINNYNINLQPKKSSKSFIVIFGKYIVNFTKESVDLLIFFGKFCINLLHLCVSPLQLPFAEFTRTIRETAISGMGVVILLSFLIGVTLAYQMAPQFISYGLNIYLVNFLGVALLKEVSPLLTAVILAGRTGAAITAEIGTQKIQEEVDALETMGISTMQKIALPKILGVLIATPLVTVLGDIASMIGGAIVSNNILDINYTMFVTRLNNSVPLYNYTEGIIKSLFFGLTIALVGCFYGFRVKNNANSIGEKTTDSVVLSIILIVLIDAIFAIICQQLGL
jgi:phospholipid/cholesterol/gamma-HCH transport system permease protein